MERAKKRESAVNSVNRALEILENPYDTMDIVQKKTHALFLYSKRQLEAIQKGDRVSGSRAKLLSDVAEIVGVTSRTMSNWLNAFQAQEEVRASKRGKHASTFSPIQDPSFRTKFCSYVRENSHVQGKPSLTTTMLASWVNSLLGLEENQQYSSNTIGHWLHHCGFQVSERKNIARVRNCPDITI